MTGIERLRELIKDYRSGHECEGIECGELSCGECIAKNVIKPIADQIERDLTERSELERDMMGDTTENVRLIVGGVINDMERHVLGHEGMEDSPVARWARELREALGGRDEEVTDVAAIRKDAMEAYEWVEAHGGLEKIKQDALCWNTAEHVAQNTLDWLARVCPVAGIEKCGYGIALEKLEDVINSRLMPEGMEWLVEAWPRFEDDAPVRFGDMALIDGEADMIEAVQLWIHGRPVIYGDGGSQQLEKGERVKRPAPKVLDADGAEIRVGDEVWLTDGLGPLSVFRIVVADRMRVVCDDEKNGHLNTYPESITHRAPVLAADGKPLREGETVWKRTNGKRLTVMHLVTSVVGLVGCSDGTEAFGTPVIFNYCPSDLTHERPDSLDRLAEDIGAMLVAWRSNKDLFDAQEAAAGCVGENTLGAALDSLVRRAKKLAERDA